MFEDPDIWDTVREIAVMRRSTASREIEKLCHQYAKENLEDLRNWHDDRINKITTGGVVTPDDVDPLEVKWQKMRERNANAERE